MTSAFAHLLPRSPALPSGALADVDGAHLHEAFVEAVKGVGRTAPNPPVGAVVVKDGRVVGRGFHPRAGERHGEIVALDQAGSEARGATLYVTLEPCVHHGRTPPCVDRILREGVARVVVGAVDPNPKVHEKGIAKLRAAGVHVDVADGPLADACCALIAPFRAALVDHRAYTVLKIAATLDGRIATRTGQSKWITGPSARALVHRLRDAVDAVVVGAGTVVADDPELTVRDVEGGRNPRRVVVDRRLRTNASHRVYARRPNEPAPTIFTPTPVTFAEHAPFTDLKAAFEHLARQNVMAALVEAGPGLATALLEAELVDELWWFTAPTLFGADARPAIGDLHLDLPRDAAGWTVAHRVEVGPDSLTVLQPASR